MSTALSQVGSFVIQPVVAKGQMAHVGQIVPSVLLAAEAAKGVLKTITATNGQVLRPGHLIWRRGKRGRCRGTASDG